MLFALVAAVLRPHAGALPERLGPRQGVLSSSSLERMGDATRRERWAPGKMSSPIKHELPCVKSEPALMTHPGERECQRVRRRQAPSRRRARCPPLTAAGNTGAARPAPPTPPTPPTRAALAIAPPVNPGCPTRLLVTGELVAAVVPPGVMAAFPRLRPKACIRIARPPGMFCPLIHDGAITRAIAGHDGRRCKARVAPPLRAKMYRMCRRPLASFSKCTEGL